jgi:hypothetical protein
VYQHAETTFEPVPSERLAKFGDQAREQFHMFWLASPLIWRYMTSYRQSSRSMRKRMSELDGYRPASRKGEFSVSSKL